MYFKPLQISDFPFLHRWLNEPHVLSWYSKKKMSKRQVHEKYEAYLSDQTQIKGYLILVDRLPIGYIQCYPAKLFFCLGTHKKLDLTKTAGLDFFIGERAFLSCGYSKWILSRFLIEKVYTHYKACVVDPEESNFVAKKSYEGVGFIFFEKISSEDGLVHDLYVVSFGRKAMDQIRKNTKQCHSSNQRELILKNT